MNSVDCLVLFSGGLDSLLTAKLLQKQGHTPLCLHFHSPFFGTPEKVAYWKDTHQLEIVPIDASLEFTSMLAASPAHGSGKALNPCIDCKITLLRLAKARMAETGAKFIATGEVIGQRPMSQRRDSMNIIAKESGCSDVLLRPLCAKYVASPSLEICNLVSLDELPAISGRGRKPQLELAHDLGIADIPAPGGGCLLTEIETCRRYWVLLQRYKKQPSQTIASLVEDFQLANLGRMYANLAENLSFWLSIGRNRSDNEKILNAKRENDIVLRLPFPGPVALCRDGKNWPAEKLCEAAAILLSCSSRAGTEEITVETDFGQLPNISCRADRSPGRWGLPEWTAIRETLRTLRREQGKSRHIA